MHFHDLIILYVDMLDALKISPSNIKLTEAPFRGVIPDKWVKLKIEDPDKWVKLEFEAIEFSSTFIY